MIFFFFANDNTYEEICQTKSCWKLTLILQKLLMLFKLPIVTICVIAGKNIMLV